MEQSFLDSIHQWFDGYVHAFYDTDSEGLKNIKLKVEHTKKVCEIMDLLTAGENLPEDDRRIAAAVALLHDVGRFPQYRRWRTFRDSDSDNHARMAIDVIREHKLLDGLVENERLLIQEAVRFHNLLELPDWVSTQDRMFMSLIRDADKLDIWRVFVELYAKPSDEQASAACLGLPDLPEYTDACVKDLLEKRVVRLENCRVLNDFKLIQISWALDLNFTTSYRLLLKRNYLQRVSETLLTRRQDVDRAVQEILAEAELRGRR